MSLSSRLAAAAGASAAGAAALLLAQRYDGTVPVLLMMVLTARAAGPGAALPDPAAAGTLRRQALLVPAWVLLAAAASVRAGSTVLADVAGAHGVAGLALARGPVMTVAGMWLAALGAAVAIAGSHGRYDEPGTEPLARGIARRLETLGMAAQIGFAAALIAGPQIREWTDAAGWAAAAAALGVWSWFGRHAAQMPVAPLAAAVLCGGGLLLVLAGGRP